MSRVFRHPVNNQRLTRALFLEESYDDRTFVLYTLKDKEHDGYQSLYQCYMGVSDPTEIRFAQEYFESWEHWNMVAESTWFKPYIGRWREELEVRIRSKALAAVIDVADDKYNKLSYEANKFLLSGAWKSKEEKEKVGRPSKEKIKEEAHKLFQDSKQEQDDYKRLMQ